MKIFFVLFFFLISTFAWGGLDIKDDFNKVLTILVKEGRESALSTARSPLKIGKKIVLTENLSVTPRSFMGEGSSSVYLGTTQEGKEVIIKHYVKKSDRFIYLDWLKNSYAYEYVMTEFFLDHGISMPKVIYYSVSEKEAILIKEYAYGLTENEWSYLNIKRDKKSYQAINGEIAKFKKLYQSEFKNWIENERPDLKEHYHPDFRFYGYEAGDFDQFKNWIYDLARDKFILIDP